MKPTSPENLPKHVAIIMDGNGRWAKKWSLNRLRGHQEGSESVREIVRASRKIGIQYLTLYAFSEENWKRPATEVHGLMKLLKRFLKKELREMQENGIRLRCIGRPDKLPEDTREVLYDTMVRTAANRDMVLTLALSYGGRQEIFDAVRKIAAQIEKGELTSDQLTEQVIAGALYTAGMPDPDLLIRTSGEYRVSNFLLWQIAYTEIYITATLWPDFRKEEYLQAITDFQSRERRFGTARD
jgi:undecaprenyl diphosphate synthase